MRLQGFLTLLHRLEDTVLALLLSGMILLAAAQILLRNFFDVSLLWADPLLRVSVLWIGLLGAVAAARENKHISIDLVSKFIAPKTAIYVTMLTQVFAAYVTGLICYHSITFVRYEYEDGNVAVADIPVWIFESIIPFAFAVLTLRFLIKGGMQLQRLRPDLKP